MFESTGVLLLKKGMTQVGEMERISMAEMVRVLKLGVTNGGTEATGAAVLRPAVGTYLLGDGTVSGRRSQ